MPISARCARVCSSCLLLSLACALLSLVPLGSGRGCVCACAFRALCCACRGVRVFCALCCACRVVRACCVRCVVWRVTGLLLLREGTFPMLPMICMSGCSTLGLARVGGARWAWLGGLSPSVAFPTSPLFFCLLRTYKAVEKETTHINIIYIYIYISI